MCPLVSVDSLGSSRSDPHGFMNSPDTRITLLAKDFSIVPTGVASDTKPGHLIELKYVLILKIYRALDKNDSFLIV